MTSVPGLPERPFTLNADELHIHYPERELTDEEVRIEAIHAASTFLAPSLTVTRVTTGFVVQTADIFAHYIRTGQHPPEQD